MFRPMGMVGEACLPSTAYYPRTPDYTLCSGFHICWSEHSDSSFVYGFMSLDYGSGTMTATTLYEMADPIFWEKYEKKSSVCHLLNLPRAWSVLMVVELYTQVISQIYNIV